MGTLPGGSESSGSTGIVFKQIAALGEAECWVNLHGGLFLS